MWYIDQRARLKYRVRKWKREREKQSGISKRGKESKSKKEWVNWKERETQ